MGLVPVIAGMMCMRRGELGESCCCRVYYLIVTNMFLLSLRQRPRQAAGEGGGRKGFGAWHQKP